jgi:hypothetical protein
VTRTLWVGLGAAAAALLVTSCSASKTDYKEAAVDVIQSQLQDTLNIGELTGECEEPASNEVGTTFACTATTSDDQTITFTAEIKDKKTVNVQSTNVLTVENLRGIESEAARILSEKVGQTLPAKNIDCGSKPVIAEAGEAFVCALTDPGNPANVYDASITLDDLTNPSQLNVDVASTPRG